jgi:hypothetical protein
MSRGRAPSPHAVACRDSRSASGGTDRYGTQLFLLLIVAHCKENPIHVLIFWELHGLSPNFHIHVSVSDLYIPRIGPHISLQQNWQTDPGNM